jgi:hypothetical protein
MVMLCKNVSHILFHISRTWPDLVAYLTRLFQDTGIILAIGKTSHGVLHVICHGSKTWPDLVVYLTRLFQDTGIILRFAIGKTSHGNARDLASEEGKYGDFIHLPVKVTTMSTVCSMFEATPSGLDALARQLCL